MYLPHTLSPRYRSLVESSLYETGFKQSDIVEMYVGPVIFILFFQS